MRTRPLGLLRLDDRINPVVLTDNLPQATFSIVSLTGDRWLTSSFATDASAYNVTSATLRIAGDPGDVAVVSIFSDDNLQPDDLVGTFTSPAGYTETVSNTTFTSTGIRLEANRTYWVVLKATAGTIDWAFTNSSDGTGVGFQHSFGETEDAGSTWFTTDVLPTQMRVDGDVAAPANTAGTLAFSSATFTASEGSGTATITVSRTGGTTGAVSVPVTVSGGSAAAGTDFAGLPATATFAAGQSSAKVTVAITDDTLVEGSETIVLGLGSATGGAAVGNLSTATLTINDNDTAPSAGAVAFSSATYTAAEGSGTLTVSLTRTGGSAGAVSVPITVSGGTATTGSDYSGLPATVDFPDGQTSASVTVNIVSDTNAEAAETITVALGTPTGGAALGGQTTATLTIGDDDAVKLTAAAAGSGAPTVVVYGPDGKVVRTITAFDGSFTGGVRVATADLTGDGTDDIVVGAGPGGPATVRVFDGATGDQLASFTAFETAFTGGVFVAAGDVTGDGKAEVVVSPDQGGGPVVAVYSGSALAAGTATQLSRFFGIDDANFRGGARPALGDLTGDGKADLVVSAGFLGGPRVAVFNGATLPSGSPTRLINDFFAFETTLRNGAFVAVGDVTGDGRADLVFGGGPGGGPRVRLIDGAKLLSVGAFVNLDDVASTVQRANFFAGGSSLRGGVRVALDDANGDGPADLTVGSGEGEQSRVQEFFAANLLGNASPTADRDFDPFAAVLANGVFVG